MRQYVDMYFDGSWEGILTAIFEVFEYKLYPLSLQLDIGRQQGLFQDFHQVITQEHKVDRIEKGLLEKVGKKGIAEFWHTYLSELPMAPLLIVKTAMYYFQSEQNTHSNFAQQHVIQIKNIVKSVSRERHRMKAFVRFQRLKDGLYVAIIEPDFNVLPLIQMHFQKRYADQQWLIYDLKREYGLYYNLQVVSRVTPLNMQTRLSQNSLVELYDEDESLYADLWKRYFKAVNIKERKNTKLHVQHVPKRYWKYLNEKGI
ncbi:TIGR03915 family putative DNA repair protein [Sphingobacterium sp. LRF_L2]|uniref:TIGR03915 family putative DNA repair protein n=1 Tax=Sphingobacterium sp. LRF_L2 TaxID=3369421 RepID=UPI003F63E6DF